MLTGSRSVAPVLLPVTVYVIVSPGSTTVPDAGSADFEMSKPATGCSVTTAGGTSGSPGPGGVPEAVTRFSSCSPSTPSLTTTE